MAELTISRIETGKKRAKNIVHCHSLLNVAVSNMTFLRGIGSNPMEIGNFSKLWHTSNFFC
jgi:hypothetical protein